jgi:hypothetical protein
VEPRYVFIVGLPRTGTKLVKNILENSSQEHCKISPENFFLGHLITSGIRNQIRRIGDMSDDGNVYKLVEYMYSGKPDGGLWKRLRDGTFNITKDALAQEILSSGRTDKEIYRIILQLNTEVTDNTLLGDKTPAHLYHVPTLMTWFPEAKVVHTFRDPRAILASEWRKRTAGKFTNFPASLFRSFYSFSIVLHVTLTWLYAVRLHHRYRKGYPHNYYLAKFEDIINAPEPSVRELCEFLEIEFQPEMLNPPRVGSSYGRGGGAGFDKQTLARWQTFLKPWMNVWLLIWVRRYLREFGYIR